MSQVRVQTSVETTSVLRNLTHASGTCGHRLIRSSFQGQAILFEMLL